MISKRLLVEKAPSRLRKALPGIEAHLLMAPSIGGKPYRKFTPDGAVPRQSAALLLLVGGEDEPLKIPLTLRSGNLANHGGQISFPGGRSEPKESPEETALRETCEEIGVCGDEIQILGRLSELYVPPSNSTITPVVGAIDSLGELKLNPAEVEEAFFAPLDNFFKKDFRGGLFRNFGGERVFIPYWKAHPKVPLWGATAMILSEALWICKEICDI